MKKCLNCDEAARRGKLFCTNGCRDEYNAAPPETATTAKENPWIHRGPCLKEDGSIDIRSVATVTCRHCSSKQNSESLSTTCHSCRRKLY